MNKIVYVPAFFKPVYKKVTKKVPTGEKKKGLFGGEKDILEKITEDEMSGYSDKHVDGERLSQDISNVVADLNNNNYEVISVMPVTSGEYDYKYNLIEPSLATQLGGAGAGYGYGYSYTEGVTIIAKKIT